jgi:hypothetical protein
LREALEGRQNVLGDPLVDGTVDRAASGEARDLPASGVDYIGADRERVAQSPLVSALNAKMAAAAGVTGAWIVGSFIVCLSS